MTNRRFGYELIFDKRTALERSEERLRANGFAPFTVTAVTASVASGGIILLFIAILQRRDADVIKALCLLITGALAAPVIAKLLGRYFQPSDEDKSK